MPGSRTRPRPHAQPWLIAAALAVAYLLANPPSADLAAQVYRTGLFEREGFTLWNGQWYAGHHAPGYSVLFPPVAALLGPRLVAALAAVAAAALFERLARGHFDARGSRVAALWFGAATAMNLVTGRLAFALGVAVGLAALLALQRGRAPASAALGALASLASPVAGLFLALAGLAHAVATRRAGGAVVALAALGTALALGVLFPEGGVEPFVASSFWPALLALAALLAALPAEQRVLRAGIAIYALALVAAFALDTPMGGNAIRLGALFAGPVVAGALWSRRPAVVAALALPLLYWQWYPPIRDYLTARGDPSVAASYYAPLLAFLERRAATEPPFRVEIPFTKNHWEAARVAPRVPLARGWERQLDVKYHGLFYRSPLTAAGYRAWLDENAVRYVALADARLDGSARAEARLIRRGLPYLRPVWRRGHWRVFEVSAARPLARGRGRLLRLDSDAFDLRADGPGTIDVAVRFTPYWALARGDGCVERGPGDWTRLRIRRAGAVRVVTRFSPGRVLSRGPRCTAA